MPKKEEAGAAVPGHRKTENPVRDAGHRDEEGDGRVLRSDPPPQNQKAKAASVKVADAPAPSGA